MQPAEVPEYSVSGSKMKIDQLRIIGTAHVSSESIEEVRRTIAEVEPDVVAVELDPGRYRRLLDEKLGVERDDFSLRDALRHGNIGVLLAAWFLTYFQRKVGDDIGVKPGAEMLAAIEAAQEVGARVVLIDRDIGVTMQRALKSMGALEKMKFFLGVIRSFWDSEGIDDIESLKGEETLRDVMAQFRDISPSAYHVLVEERDAYMARRLLEIEEDSVVAVVGAGHRRGICEYLKNPERIPPIHELLKIP